MYFVSPQMKLDLGRICAAQDIEATAHTDDKYLKVTIAVASESMLNKTYPPQIIKLQTATQYVMKIECCIVSIVYIALRLA